MLLRELIPSSIASTLMSGSKVEPESFDNSTIFFSDIVSFTSISASATPYDVVQMLNKMYTIFDDVSGQYDVYKVATIGDAYYVVSGVPVRNRDRHAGEVCGMAVQLLQCGAKFTLPNSQETLKLRIGIHSGPCVAGVAGIKMPRYLLFGDTVDIASRMEAAGASMKIHISPSTKQLLEPSRFRVQDRGQSFIPGLGQVTTYWLTDGL